MGLIYELYNQVDALEKRAAEAERKLADTEEALREELRSVTIERNALLRDVAILGAQLEAWKIAVS